MRNISNKLLTWYKKNGRQELPWRFAISPYRVWLSEIMLQQTQVKTVINYFNNFIATFPTVIDLANATEDEILHLWSGLGYYSRARNLYKTAKIIRDNFNGKFPTSLSDLEKLPGIGRSTAGAISAIAFKQSAPILDGNVKRVLARLLALQDWPGSSNSLSYLWDSAEQLTPKENAGDYAQAIMDLGATICTRSNPKCEICPLQHECRAFELKLTTELPKSKLKKKLPQKSTLMLIIKNQQGEILLEKRPPVGIWGSLWCLPVCEFEQNIHDFCQQQFALQVEIVEHLASFRHTFSHFHLDISPIILTAHITNTTLYEAKSLLWYNQKNPKTIGLATPIKKLISVARGSENR